MHIIYIYCSAETRNTPLFTKGRLKGPVEGFGPKGHCRICDGAGLQCMHAVLHIYIYIFILYCTNACLSSCTVIADQLIVFMYRKIGTKLKQIECKEQVDCSVRDYVASLVSKNTLESNPSKSL